MTTRLFGWTSALTLSLLASSACAAEQNRSATDATQSEGSPIAADVQGNKPGKEKADIVDTAISAGSFTTLVAALQATGLDEALRGEGPFTVFAPSDEAFAKLGAETIEQLLADPEALSAILLYHVVSGSVDSSTVVTIPSAETLNGADISVRPTEDGLFINDSKVIAADVMASNGIIHVIDTVLIPPAASEAP
jgi:uncharacterized surface protein with fasciclin (FAS1) repeats